MKQLFYVKDAEGNLVEATTDQVLDTDIVLFNEKGESLNRTEKTKAPDPVDKLTGIVTELASSMAGMKDAITARDEKLEQYKELAAKGFKVPEDGDDPIDKDSYNGYSLAKQGGSLHYDFKHVIADDKKDVMAKYFIDFVKASSAGARDADKDRFNDNWSSGEKTAIGDSGNTFVVPDIVEAEIMHFAREKSVVLQDARVVDMTSEKQSYPSESGASSVAWGNTTAQSDPTVSEVELDAEELSAYTVVRNTTLADTKSDIVSWLAGMMAEAVGQELDNVAFNGDGTSTYGNCSGVLSAAAGFSVVMGSGSTAFSQITDTEFSLMIAELDGIRKEGAKFYMNGGNLHYVRNLKNTDGTPTFYPGFVGTNTPPEIHGYPYKEVIKCPSTSAANTAFVSFGNLKYFFAGKRNGVMSLQVDPWGLWASNRMRFKIYNRWGCKIGLGGGFVRLITASS